MITASPASADGSVPFANFEAASPGPKGGRGVQSTQGFDGLLLAMGGGVPMAPPPSPSVISPDVSVTLNPESKGLKSRSVEVQSDVPSNVELTSDKVSQQLLSSTSPLTGSPEQAVQASAQSQTKMIQMPNDGQAITQKKVQGLQQPQNPVLAQTLQPQGNQPGAQLGPMAAMNPASGMAVNPHPVQLAPQMARPLTSPLAGQMFLVPAEEFIKIDSVRVFPDSSASQVPMGIPSQVLQSSLSGPSGIAAVTSELKREPSFAVNPQFANLAMAPVQSILPGAAKPNTLIEPKFEVRNGSYVAKSAQPEGAPLTAAQTPMVGHAPVGPSEFAQAPADLRQLAARQPSQNNQLQNAPAQLNSPVQSSFGNQKKPATPISQSLAQPPGVSTAQATLMSRESAGERVAQREKFGETANLQSPPVGMTSQPIQTPAPTEMQAVVTQGSQNQNRFSSEAVQTMTQNLTFMRGSGGGEMKIHLRPENLGELSIQVSTQGNQIQLRVKAGSSEAKEALEASIGDLKEKLAVQNLQLMGTDFSISSSAQSALNNGLMMDSKSDTQSQGQSNQQHQSQHQAFQREGLNRDNARQDSAQQSFGKWEDAQMKSEAMRNNTGLRNRLGTSERLDVRA